MGIFCLLYQNKLAALASGELPEGLAQRVERHLSVCPDCLSEWAAQQRMAQSLRAATPVAQQASPLLWERLELAIREGSPPTAAQAPHHFTNRRLAPLGGLALAGAAAAATLFVVRPQSPQSPSVPKPMQVAQLPSATPAPALLATPLPTVAPKRLTALELARASAAEVTRNKPTKDPFATHEQDNSQDDSGERLIQRIRKSPLKSASFVRRRKILPDFETHREEGLPLPAQKNAVAMMEVGMTRIIEETQTADFNQRVTEAQKKDSGPTQQASDALVAADTARRLF